MAAPEQTIYTFETSRRFAHGTWRFRVEIFLAHDSHLVNATEMALPPGTILKESFTDGGFDGVVIGLGEPETQTMRLKYRQLPDGLAQGIAPGSGIWLNEPVVDSNGDPVGTQTQRIGASSVWLIYSDEGDKALGTDEFALVFMGVQPRQDNGRYKFPADDTIFEVTLKPMQQVAFEGVSGSTAAAAHLSWIFALSTPTPFNYIYDYAYDAGGYVWSYAQGHPNQFAFAFSVNAHANWLILLAGAVMKRILRYGNNETTGALEGDYPGIITWGADGSGGGGDAGGINYLSIGEALCLYKQNVTADQNSRGLENPPLQHTDLYFIGAISNTASPSNVAWDSPEWIGGLLVPKGDSFHNDPTGWDTLKSLCHFAGIKLLLNVERGTSELGTYYGIRGEPCLLLDNASPDDAERTSNTETLLPSDFMPGWELSVGENDIRSCEVVYDSLPDKNVERAEFGIPRNRNEQPMALTPAFHTAPSVPPEDDSTVDAKDNPPEFAIRGARFAYARFDVRKVFYLDQPAWAQSTVALRPHDYCQLYYRGGPSNSHFGYDTDPINQQLPAPPSLGLMRNSSQALKNAKDKFFTPLKDHMLKAQLDHTSAVVLCKTIVAIYSKSVVANPDFAESQIQDIRNQNGTRLVKGKLPVKYAHPRYRGRKFYLNFTEATTKTPLWDSGNGARKAILLRAKPDWKTGLANVELLTLDDLLLT